MKQSIMLNSRQKQLLQTLIEEGTVTYEYLSDSFKLSTRTIRREIKALTKTLKHLDITITRKMGSGMELQGSPQDIAALKKQLINAKVMSSYSKEERQEGIAYDLLLSNEPLKQGYFSTKYDVSIATVATDLDMVCELLESGGLTVNRSPGIGIEVIGTEKQRRTLLSRLLHKDITFEDWMELFHKKRTEVDLYGKLGNVIRSRLLKFVQMDKILLVDRVLKEALAEHDEITLNDRSYVNLMIHILLAMERIEDGKVIEDTHLTEWEPMQNQTLSIAEKVVKRLGQSSGLHFPQIEIKYIALHLAGSKLVNQRENKTDMDADFFWIEVTQSFIRSVEFYLEESFEGDQLLFEGLVSHFVPVYNRLKYNLQIHNPMLDSIMENYPDVFLACERACNGLTEKLGYEIPKDEIGYLAMHIGASILRIKEGMRNSFKAVVVCASGLGTSMYLATKIRSEIQNVEVEAIVSVNDLENWLETSPSIDIIISTVNVPTVTKTNMVIVSPFLKKTDVTKIRNMLASALHQTPQNISRIRGNATSRKAPPSLKSVALYGEGMLHVMRHFHLYEDVHVSADVIPTLVNLADLQQVIVNPLLLIHHLKQREKMGGFVLGNLAMIHTKSEGVLNPLVTLYRLNKPVSWYGDDKGKHTIYTIILLVVPPDAPKEHMEIVSEVSASLIDDGFVHILETGTKKEVKSVLNDILLKSFETKAASILKELH